MGIGNALKGLTKQAKVPAAVAGGALLVTGADAVDNATSPSTASPVVVINSESPSTTAKNAPEGTLEWVMAMSLLNGTGFNGNAGMGGNGTDKPTLESTKNSGGFVSYLPLIIGIVAVGAVLFVVFRKKRGKR